jgi:hypothetical protein
VRSGFCQGCWFRWPGFGECWSSFDSSRQSVGAEKSRHSTYLAVNNSIRRQGCQIFRGKIYQNGENIPNDHKIYQSAINYTKWQENLPNDYKIYQTHPWQEPTNFSQTGIFGLKTNHLATLLSGPTHICSKACYFLSSKLGRYCNWNILVTNGDSFCFYIRHVAWLHTVNNFAAQQTISFSMQNSFVFNSFYPFQST